MDITQRENLLEELGQLGCRKINIILHTIDQGDIPNELEETSAEDRSYLYEELKSIMAVYAGKSCDL